MSVRFVVGQALPGRAINLNGSSQYLFSNGDFSSVTNNWTISMWVNVKGYPASGNACFFENGQIDANGYRVVITNAGLLRTLFSTVLNLSSGFTLSLNTWYHILVVRNAGSTQHYVNGVAQGSPSSTTPFGPNGWALIGAARSSTPTVSEFANAIIEDVRFYERALSTTEITNLYNQALDPSIIVSASNLKAQWKLDELSGLAVNSANGSYTMSNIGSANFVQGKVLISNYPPRLATGTRVASGPRITVPL